MSKLISSALVYIPKKWNLIRSMSILKYGEIDKAALDKNHVSLCLDKYAKDV